MAVSALSWSAGGVIGPAVGGFLLSHSGALLWLTQATVLAIASASAVLGERLLPVRVRQIAGQGRGGDGVRPYEGLVWITAPLGDSTYQYPPFRLVAWPIAAPAVVSATYV